MQVKFQNISSKGQLVIPAKWRKKLGLKSNSKVTLVFDDSENEVRVKKSETDPIEKGLGFLAGQGVSFQDLLNDKYEETKKEDQPKI